MSDMRLGIVAEVVDRATTKLQKIWNTLKKLEGASGVNEKLVDKGTRALERQKRAMDRLKASADTLKKGAGKVARGAALGAGLFTAVSGGAALAANQLLGPAAQFERFQTILTGTEGSALAAEKAMGWVSDFAVKTPYELDTVMDSFVKLRSYGLDPTNGLLQTLGDTSAAMGKPLMQAVEAIADAITGENERLKEFGITASKAGQQITYEFTNAAGETERRVVQAGNRLAIQQTLMEIWAAKFGGSMNALSMTWEGMVSNISDLWLKFQLMIMQSGLFDWMKGRLSDVLNVLNTAMADGTALQWATEIGSTIQSILMNAWTAGKALASVLQTIGRVLSTAAAYVGGWEQLAYVLMAMAALPTLMSVASGVFLIAKGLALIGVHGTALIALKGLGLGMRAIGGTGLLAGRSVMLLGRAIMTLGGGSLWLVGGALKGLGAGIAALPSMLVALAGGMKTAALAAVALPGRLLAASRAFVVMAAGAIRALPGLLMGVARSLFMMAAGAIRTLPATLMAVARSLLATAAAGLRSLPAALMGVAMALRSMAVGGLAALPGLLASAGSAFMALGAAMMATPIGWIVAGIAAVAGGAYLIYRNWDKIGPWFASLWQGIKDKLQAFWAWLTSFDWLSALPDFPAMLADMFNFKWPDFPMPELPDLGPWVDKAGELIGGAVETVGAVASKAYGSIRNLFSNDTAVDIAVRDPASIERASAAAGALQQKLAAVNATDMGEANRKLAAIRQTAEALPPMVQTQMERVRAVVAALDLTGQGQRIMQTLANGMRSRAQAVVDEIRRVTQQVRDHLPSSPAKTGPLSDLHRLKFAETIAVSIRPEPMVKAMRVAAAATLASVPLATIPVATAAAAPAMAEVNAVRPSDLALRGAGLASQGGARGSAPGAGVTVHYSPTIRIEGGASGGMDAEALKALLADQADELVAMIERRMAERDRLEF